MTLANIPGGVWFPEPPVYGGTLPTPASNLLDAATEKFAFVFRCPKAGVIDKFEIRTVTAPTPPANGLKFSIQGVDATGAPDGVVGQFRVLVGITANSWLVPGLITSDGTDGGVKRTVAQGELIACVVEFQSFTAGDSVNIATLSSGGVVPNFPFGNHFAGAGPSWTKQADSLCIGLKYSDGSYGYFPGNIPYSAVAAPTYNSGSSPDEKGMKFVLPFKSRASGAICRVDMDGPADIVLYDSDGVTPLVTIAHTSAMRASNLNTNFFYKFPVPQILNAGVPYRLTVRPATVTSLAIPEMDFSSPELQKAMSGGQLINFTSRTDAGAWTDLDTKRTSICLLLDQLDDGSGSGGSGGIFF